MSGSTLDFTERRTATDWDVRIFPIFARDSARIKNRFSAARARIWLWLIRRWIASERRRTRLPVVWIGANHWVIDRWQPRVNRDEIPRISFIQKGCNEFLLKENTSGLFVNHIANHQSFPVAADNKVASLYDGGGADVTARITSHLPTAFVQFDRESGIRWNVDEVVRAIVAAHDARAETNRTGGTALPKANRGTAANLAARFLEH